MKIKNSDDSQIIKSRSLFFLKKGVSNYPVYKHIEDKSYWQYTFNGRYKTLKDNVNSFPGFYNEIIEKYNKSPFELIEKKIFVEVDVLEMFLI